MIELATGTMGKPVLLAGGFTISLVAYTVGTAVYRIWLHPLSKIPGPRRLAATDLFIMFKSYISLGMSETAVQLHHKYGPIVRVGPNRVIVDGSLAWSQVFGRRSTSEADEFGKIPGFIMDGDDQTILGANRTVHHRQRRHMAHAFSTSSLQEQEAIIKNYVDKLVAAIESHARKQESLNIVHWFNYATFDIIGDLTFADTFGSLDGDTTFVDNIFLGLQGHSISVFLKMFPLMKAPLMLLMGSKELKIAQKAGMVNERLGMTKAQARIAMDEKITESGRRDFSTYMLRRGKDGEEGLSHHEIILNSSLLVLAGSETTATALSGAIFLLGRPENASKRQRLVDEVCSAFSTESAIDMTSTASLEYLMAVLEETMRMCPPTAALTPRQSPGAEVGGHWLPKGTAIHFNSKATHRNPEYFKDPNSFVPERIIGITGQNTIHVPTTILIFGPRSLLWLNASHPFHTARYDSDRKDVFKPFSAGTRDCIGKNLAYAEMRTILSRLIFRFDFEVLPGQDDWAIKQANTPLIWIKGELKVRSSLRKLAVAGE